MVANFHDGDGHVAVPHFYDNVRLDGHSARLARTGRSPSDEEILRDAGAREGWGESGYSLYERTTSRPALTINGFTGGYQGPGGKSVIPARASVKLSFRLVPDQDPGEIERLVRRHVARLAPDGVQVTVRTHSRAQPALVELKHPAMRAAAVAPRTRSFISPRFTGVLPPVSIF
jgi:acetylornithine deacetylase/succinyl-diaminopimelate desuccinylase-like protein